MFKNKGVVQIPQLMRDTMMHTMKIWKEVVEVRLREEVMICEQQSGFMPRKSPTDVMFTLRLLMGK